MKWKRSKKAQQEAKEKKSHASSSSSSAAAVAVAAASSSTISSVDSSAAPAQHEQKDLVPMNQKVTHLKHDVHHSHDQQHRQIINLNSSNITDFNGLDDNGNCSVNSRRPIMFNENGPNGDMFRPYVV